MNITGVSGANTGMGQGMNMGNNMKTDPVVKNFLNQIANAQKELQALSTNDEMTPEDKMKKRQEIQQEIASLNQQLRQYQMEQRKEKQQKELSMDDMLGEGSKSNVIQGSQTGAQGISQATMSAMISADSSMKQAKVQGAVSTKMEGKAGVLEIEIKLDKSRGGSTLKKEEELAEVKEKAQTATAAQLSTLADANKTIEEAAKAEQEAAQTEKENDKEASKAEKEMGVADKTAAETVAAGETETAAGTVAASETETTAGTVTASEQATAAETVTASEQATANVSQPVPYVSVDIRL